MAELFAWATIKNALGNVLGAVIAFFSDWPLRAWVGLVLVASLAFWWSGQRGYDRGVADMYAREERLATRATDAGVIFRGQILGLNESIKVDLASRFKAIDITFDTMQREVIRYVSLETDRRYPLACGFVRVRDAAFLGVDPARLTGPGCQRDDATAPASASAFLAAEIEWGRYTGKLEAQNQALRNTITGYRAAYAAWRVQLQSIKE